MQAGFAGSLFIGIFFEQGIEAGGSFPVLQNDVGETLFEQGFIDIVRLRIAFPQLLHDRCFLDVFFLQSGHESFLVQSVVARRGIEGYRFVVGRFGVGEAALRIEAVGQPGTGVGDTRQIGIVRSLDFDVMGELRLCTAEIVLLEIAVSEIVVSERIYRVGGFQICQAVFYGSGEVLPAIEAIGQPQIGIGFCFRIVIAEANGLYEVIGGTVQVVIGKSFGSQPIQNALFGFEYLCSRALYFIDGVESRPVIAGCHIHVDEIIVDGIGITGFRKKVEKLFEYGNRLGKGRESCRMQRKGVIVESYLLYFSVEIVLRSHFESEACIGRVVEAEVTLSDEEVGALGQRIFFTRNQS